MTICVILALANLILILILIFDFEIWSLLTSLTPREIITFLHVKLKRISMRNEFLLGNKRKERMRLMAQLQMDIHVVILVPLLLESV